MKVNTALDPVPDSPCSLLLAFREERECHLHHVEGLCNVVVLKLVLGQLHHVGDYIFPVVTIYLVHLSVQAQEALMRRFFPILENSQNLSSHLQARRLLVLQIR